MAEVTVRDCEGVQAACVAGPGDDRGLAAGHVVRGGPGRRVIAGRAWSHLAGSLAGVFDMDVWPPHGRQGLGTGLLRAVCAAAAGAGATHAVLNATPDGERLYETCGFRRIGEGSTWWLHP